MKIALVCPYDIAYPGGVQNHVLQFAHHARRLGHSVTVLAPASRENCYVDHKGVDFVNMGRTVPLPIGIGTVSRFTFSFWNKGRLHEFLSNGNFDVVHIHSPEAPILGPLAAKYVNTESTVLVTTSHSNTSPNPVTWFYSMLARLFGIDKLIQKVDVRLAVSEAAKAKANHYLPGNYTVIPNGIDTERFSPKVGGIEKYLDGKVNILFVGRLGNNERRKGLYYLVSAFSQMHLNPKYSNTRLLVVGPGEPDAMTRQLLGAVDNKDIVLVGGVPTIELQRYYATAHIFAATPTDGESFGFVVPEAMASGKPVVTTNIPGPRDVLLGFRKYGEEVMNSEFFVAEAGILVQPRDIEATAAALERLVLNEEMRLRMGQNGRRIVVENFSWDVVAPRILAVYEQLMAVRQQRQQQKELAGIA
ncbi:glycosyltransferase family 4 protein [Candidatus Woesearchaeota archaeon]|nr:glycosyltransferase family 4 protein [Candidatus Woesearchaeota archaeon]